MNKWILGAALSLGAGTGVAADEVTLQLKWVTQAQFAGYYVAQDQGFYEAEGLDVTIKPGGPDIAPPQVLAGGGADVIVEWMPAALAARERGLPLVNIAQPFKSSGMMLTCWKDAGIESPEDLDNRTLGVWFYSTGQAFRGKVRRGVTGIWIGNVHILGWVVWIVLEAFLWGDDGDTWTYFAAIEFVGALLFGGWIFWTARSLAE